MRAGLVDIARTTARTSQMGDCVFARTVDSTAKKQRTMALNLGYSDAVSVLPQRPPPLHRPTAPIQSRDDPSFLGIIGLHDTLRLPLQPGRQRTHPRGGGDLRRVGLHRAGRRL
jgi:hypothetical protein